MPEHPSQSVIAASLNRKIRLVSRSRDIYRKPCESLTGVMAVTPMRVYILNIGKYGQMP
jgi:hypothetical protein